MASDKLQVAGEPSDGTTFGSTANPGIGSQFGQTKFLAIHSASLKSKKEDEVNHRRRRYINYQLSIFNFPLLSGFEEVKESGL